MDLALPKTLVNSLASNGRFAQHFDPNKLMATDVWPNIHLVFATDGGKQVLSSASLDEGKPLPRKLNINQDSWKRSFRGICILMLLAKYQGKKAADEEGVIPFTINAKDNTWIYTLAGTRPTEQDTWFKTTFGVKRFLVASRGSFPKGGLFPYAHYFTNILPPENVFFYDGSKDHPIADEDLGHYAAKLESGYWTQETVPILLGLKPDLDIESVKTPDRVSFYEETNIDWTINKLLHHLSSCKDENGKWKDIPKKNKIQQETNALYTGSLLLHTMFNCRENKTSTGSNSYSVEIMEQYKDRHPYLFKYPLTRYGETALILAIALHVHPLIEYLLNIDEVDVNVRTTKGITPVLMAARMNDVDLIKRLVKKGADLNAVTYQGANAIYEAAFGASRDALQTIKYLTQCGLSCNVSCLNGTTPLSVALLRRCPENVIQFLAANTMMGKSKAKRSDAGMNVAGDMSQILGKSRLYPKTKNMVYSGILSNQSVDPFPLHTAASNGDGKEIEPLLTSEKASVDDPEPLFGNTALHIAVENCHYGMVCTLIGRGSSSRWQNNYGRTPRDLIPVNRSSGSRINEKDEASSFAKIEDELRSRESQEIHADWLMSISKDDYVYRNS